MYLRLVFLLSTTFFNFLREDHLDSDLVLLIGFWELLRKYFKKISIIYNVSY